MDDEHKLYLSRATRAFQNKSVQEVLEKVKAIVGPGHMPPIEQSELAQEALDLLLNGEKPTPKQLGALEFVIRLMRPAPLSRQGVLDNLIDEVADAFPDWTSFQNSVRPFLYSIGRIDISPKEGIGTGFLVSDGVLVTNKHVLDILSRGTGALERGQGIVRFKFESGIPDDETPADITGVLAVHDSLDIALLKIDKQELTNSRQALTLDLDPVADGHPVVAIGYPFDDPKRNPIFVSALFGGKFGVKRAAPGEVAGHGLQSFFHDCTTLGGNSGSPILSMKTARVIGLHRDGYFLFRNEAVDGASLGQFLQTHLNS